MTADIRELPTPWHLMEEACLDGDTAGVCRWLRHQGIDDMIAAFIERGCTKADRAKEIKRFLLNRAREEEQKVRQLTGRTLPKGMRPDLLDWILDQVEEEDLVHAATGEFMPEPDPDLVAWARAVLKAQLIADLERGRVPRGDALQLSERAWFLGVQRRRAP
jgi:hypothetical protein